MDGGMNFRAADMYRVPHVTDLVSGTQSEQVAWRRIGGAWWAFGADGYLKNGWIWDAAAGKWYYVG